MAAKRSNTLLGSLWRLVEENPKLATELAFQAGYWAGSAVDELKALKGPGKKTAKMLRNLPPCIAQAALRLLPSPSLQPHAPKNHARTARKPKRIKTG